jgi:ComF family protein
MLESLINLFFPKVCCGCKSFLLESEYVICTVCRHELPLTQFHLNAANEGYQKFYGRIAVEHVSTFLYFHKRGKVQEMIHSLKYRGHEEIGTLLGNWYAAELKSLAVFKTIDYIIPVPLHKKRLRERGFNQVTTFGKALSQQLSIPYDEKILVRRIYSKTQSKKNLLERMKGAESVFDVEFDISHHGKHFLIIDDVLTTGSTLENCARALLKIPGVKISIVTMAMSHS